MKKPSVLIGIPTLNGPELLDRCLRSIEAFTDPSPYDVRLLVCDDGSSSSYLKLTKDVIHKSEQLRRTMRLEMLMSPERAGIAASWNKLVRHEAADGWHADNVILLNNDVEVVEDWLDVLVHGLETIDSVGMLGLRAYSGTVQRDLEATNRVPLVPDYREAHYWNGGGKLLASHGDAFGFRRSAFDAVGGFDERYLVYYEEMDFGVALRADGHFHYVASHPVIFHMGGATMSNPEMRANDELLRSRGLFLHKWGKTPTEIRTGYGPVPEAQPWTSQLKTWRD